MSLYYINQHFSLRDSFTIKNADNEDAFYAQGEWFSWGTKITLQSIEGEEILLVQEKLFTFLSHYDFYVGEQLIGEMKRELSFFKPRYQMVRPNWTIQGDFWSHHYEIKDGQKLVARIQKKFLSWMDAYEIEVFAKDYVELILGIVIAIDADLAKDQQ